MTSSPEAFRLTDVPVATADPDRHVIRGAAAAAVQPARLDSSLHTRRAGVDLVEDVRLIDPTVGQAIDRLADRVREAARAEGYAVGWSEGQRAAAEAARTLAAEQQAAEAARQAATAQAVHNAVGALAAAATQLEHRALPAAEDLRTAVIDAALQLTQALLGYELRLAETPALDAVRRALDLAPARRPVTVHLHPDEAEAVRVGLAEMADQGREIRVVADPTVEPAGAVVDCDATRIDAQLGPALQRVREVLAR